MLLLLLLLLLLSLFSLFLFFVFLHRIKGGTGTLKRRTLPRHPRQAGLAYSVGGPMEASLEASVISAQFLSMTMSARTGTRTELVWY